MCFGDSAGTKAANRAAVQQRQEEKQRQQRIKSGTAAIDSTFAPFNDGFFAQRGKAYTDFARPQLEDQFKTAREKLVYALARNSLTNSTVAADKFANLNKTYDTSRQVIEGRGMDEANKARLAAENARSNLVSQLQATADPGAAARSAVAQSTAVAQTPGFDPLGNLFTNVTGGLADLTTNAQTGYKGLGGVSLFGGGGAGTSPSGSSRVVT
jgi:hypothetical protein